MLGFLDGVSDHLTHSSCFSCNFPSPSFKPKQLGRAKELVRSVVSALCSMAAEPPPPDLDPDDDGTLPPSKMATQVGRLQVS